MTTQEAIKKLKEYNMYIQSLKGSGNKPLKDIFDETSIAISALEKQIPKKVIKDGYKNDVCSSCGWCVYNEYAGDQRFIPHCENCGQALDWSE